MSRKSTVEYVFEYAKDTPDKVAVIEEYAQNRLTYQELANAVGNAAIFLKETGIQKGDVVVVRATQTLAYVVTYLAIHLAGGVVTSVEKNTPIEEIQKIAATVKATAVIVERENMQTDECYIYIAKEDVVIDTKKCDVEWDFPNEDDSADILFTTGTTGASKGVELSHKALTATAENLICGCEYQKDTVLIVPGPLNHANPIRKLFTTLVNGNTIFILNGMTNLKKFYDALEYQEQHMACCLPPASIRMIFILSGEKLGEYAEKIDFIESATSPLPEPDKLHLAKLLPNTRLLNNYGSSESASVCMYDYNKYPGKEGCVGKAMPNSRIFIVDDEKREMSSSKNHMGLLACEGDVNMKGYVNDPEQTREVLINGVVYTNDIGYIDEEGFVYVLGRKGDVINVGGLKVAPTEVESVALSYEGIVDCICIPVDHPISGKAVKLLVVMAEGKELNIKELKAFLATKLEGFKVPSSYEKVEHVERTYNGKLNRKAYSNKVN